jgi:capsular polysaccharide transport system ATP-binding protein
MITLIDITFKLYGRGTPDILFDGMVAHFPAFERIGIIAAPGTGKTTLARLLSGVIPPNSGHVIHNGKVSLPLGFAAGLHPELSVRRNISTMCRATGEDEAEAMLLCATLGRLEHVFDQLFKDISGKDKRSLAYCLSLAASRDVYIADDAVVFGDGRQRDEASEVLEQRLEAAGLVFLSHNASLLKKTCDRFFKLDNGRLEECCDIDEVAADFKNTASLSGQHRAKPNIHKAKSGLF